MLGARCLRAFAGIAYRRDPGGRPVAGWSAANATFLGGRRERQGPVGEAGRHGGSGGEADGVGRGGEQGLRPGSTDRRRPMVEAPEGRDRKTNGEWDHDFDRDPIRCRAPRRSACRERDQLRGRRALFFGKATRGPNHHATRRPYRWRLIANRGALNNKILGVGHDEPQLVVRTAPGRRRGERFPTLVRKQASLPLRPVVASAARSGPQKIGARSPRASTGSGQAWTTNRSRPIRTSPSRRTAISTT